MNILLAHVDSAAHMHPEDVTIIILTAVVAAVFYLIRIIRKGEF